jgi:hypothetical protein
MTKSRTVLFAAVLIGLVSPLAYGQTLKSGPPSELSSPKDVTTRQGPSAGLASLPPEAQAGISAALGRDLPAYQARPQGAGFQAENARQKLAADFTPAGVEVRSGSALCKVALRGYGYGNSLRAVGTAVPRASLNRVEYQRGWLTEWYVNGPLGLEQGFTINKPPDRADVATTGSQPLTIALALSGDLTAAMDQGSRGFTLTRRDRKAALRYSGLAARDAGGKELRAWLELEGERLLLRVEDTTARYPVVIDPWMQLAQLTASGGSYYLGQSVSVSGNTVVAGAPGTTVGGNPDQGVAFVFVKPATGWANMKQTAKLTASDGAAGDNLGWSVAVTGNTVVAGAPGAAIGGNQSQGAVYVFVKPPGGWADMTQKAKLTASDGSVAAALGSSVAIDRNTVVAGAPAAYLGSNHPEGAAYVFVKPAGGWADITQTAELTAPYSLGMAVGISGNTVVAGAPSATIGSNAWQGAAYVFVKPASGWANMTPTAQLTSSDGAADDNLGRSVGISGNTVVAGAPYASISGTRLQGAAYVFVKPASGWANMTETAKLTASNGAEWDRFGYSVAISGNTVVAGAPWATVPEGEWQGVAYVFVKPAQGWKTTSNFTAELIGSDGEFSLLGYSVSISGNTALAGAPWWYDEDDYGAAYVFGKSQ